MAAATSEDFPPREEWPHAALEQVGIPSPTGCARGPAVTW